MINSVIGKIKVQRRKGILDSVFGKIKPYKVETLALFGFGDDFVVSKKGFTETERFFSAGGLEKHIQQLKANGEIPEGGYAYIDNKTAVVAPTLSDKEDSMFSYEDYSNLHRHSMKYFPAEVGGELTMEQWETNYAQRPM